MLTRYGKIALYGMGLAGLGYTTLIVMSVMDRPKPTYGLIGRDAMVAKAQPICETLSYGRKNLRYQALSTWRYLHGTDRENLWIISASDQDGAYVAQLIFNADSGDLLVVGRASPRSAMRLSSSLTAAEAVMAANDWLFKCGIATEGDSWRLAKAPREMRPNWEITYVKPGNRVIVTIDKRSGEMVYLRRRYDHPAFNDRSPLAPAAVE